MVKLFNIEIYDSLVEAKVSDEKVRATAPSIIPTSQPATKADLANLRGDMKEGIGHLGKDLARIDATLKTLIWGIGIATIIIVMLHLS